MKDDTQMELQRIEEELLIKGGMPELQKDDLTADTVRLEDILQEFSDDESAAPDSAKPAPHSEEADPQVPAAEAPKKSADKVVLRLLIIACCLCLGIIGMLAYWLKFFLK